MIKGICKLSTAEIIKYKKTYFVVTINTKLLKKRVLLH